MGYHPKNRLNCTACSPSTSLSLALLAKNRFRRGCHDVPATCEPDSDAKIVSVGDFTSISPQADDFTSISPQADEVAGTRSSRESASPAHSLRRDRDDAHRGEFGDAGGVVAQLFEKRRGVGADAAGRDSGNSESRR